MAQLADPKHPLLGKNSAQYIQIVHWMSFANSDLIPKIATIFKSIKGDIPYNKKSVDEAQKALESYIAVLESRLLDFTYLVGERVTIADVYVASLLVRGFDFLFGKQWRAAHPNTTRWFKTLIEGDILKTVISDYKFIDSPIEYTPAKKEKKKEAAPAAKKEAAPKKEAEAPAAEAPKPKHPLEALGKPKQAIDEWKRVYSNEETRETAIPWFWKNMYDPSEWSLWKVDYKYNDELTMTFMSNNLIGGFFNRLTGSIKYIFGSMVVYGENNNNGIVGAFLVRGQDCAPAFEVAPDHESYNFTKLDATKEEDRAFINNSWAWDEPMIVNGEKREIADGKVCK